MTNWGERQRRLSNIVRAYDVKTEVTKTFTITAQPEFIERLEKHLAFISWLGSVGHSCVAGIDVDGDGPDRMRVAEKLPTIKESKVLVKGTYPDQYEKIS